jgi:hypothetical protein
MSTVIQIAPLPQVVLELHKSDKILNRKSEFYITATDTETCTKKEIFNFNSHRERLEYDVFDAIAALYELKEEARKNKPYQQFKLYQDSEVVNVFNFINAGKLYKILPRYDRTFNCYNDFKDYDIIPSYLKKFLVTDGQSDKHIVISHSSDDLLVFIADLNGNWALPNNDIPYANYVLIRSDEKWEEAKYLIAKFSNIPYDVGKILEDLLSV